MKLLQSKTIGVKIFGWEKLPHIQSEKSTKNVSSTIEKSTYDQLHLWASNNCKVNCLFDKAFSKTFGSKDLPKEIHLHTIR